MRYSKKLFVKVALTAVIILVFGYSLHSISKGASYKTQTEKKNTTGSVKNTSTGTRNLYNAANLFKDVEGTFEDLYSLNSPIRSNIKNRSRNVRWPKHDIEIWGKTAAGDYLWFHILEANATSYAKGFIKYGEITLQNLHLRFRSGPGVTPSTVPSTVKYLILTLNGRAPELLDFAKMWLDHLKHFKYLRKVALILLGNEQCNNDWILPYLTSRGGKVDLVFLIYDSTLIDNRVFFQWPLGVATYRGFPHFKSDTIKVDLPRRYLCNFLGTVYKNTSRETLKKILKRSNRCYSVMRDTWEPNESYQNMNRYLRTLTVSDLTLNPVGMNTECYRIYEAFALGSVPVVENVLTPGQCDSFSYNSPLRLLKEYNAPMILIDNWNDLDNLLEIESNLKLTDKIERRRRIVKWYENFKIKMKNKLLTIVRKKFFREE